MKTYEMNNPIRYAPWLGKWTPLGTDKTGQCVVKNPPLCSAVIVKLFVSKPK